ncbi:hypothetical protein ACHAXS_004030 [Conticribra weissflogii]
MAINQKRLVLRSRLSQWAAITRYTRKKRQFQKEIFTTWQFSAAKQKRLRRHEREARKAIRACRMANGLEVCSIGLARHFLSQVNEYVEFIERQQAACVPISKRVDALLESFQLEALGADERVEATVSSDERNEPNQSNGLNETCMEAVNSLMKLDELLSTQNGSKGLTAENEVRWLDRDQILYQESSSLIKKVRSLLNQPYLADGQFTNDPLGFPHGKTLDLEKLADVVQTIKDEAKRLRPRVSKKLRHQKYITTGIEDDPLLGVYSGKDSNDNPKIRHSDTINEKNKTGISMDIVDVDNELDIEFDNNDHIMSEYLKELSNFKVNAYRQGQTHINEDEPNSLVDSISMNANYTLTAIQEDAAQSDLYIRSSQIHLTNYNEYIEKKKKQRVQCSRDIKVHCCTCRGPHISKPPFTHVKGEYRREPTHVHRQGDKCLFLKKKKDELRWLDDVLAKYGNNRERFEREIQNRELDAEMRKEELRDNLANSLMLMDMSRP